MHKDKDETNLSVDLVLLGQRHTLGDGLDAGRDQEVAAQLHHIRAAYVWSQVGDLAGELQVGGSNGSTLGERQGS